MNRIYTFLTIMIVVSSACNSDSQSVKSVVTETDEIEKRTVAPTIGGTIATRFVPPTGYNRLEYAKNSYGSYLQNFKLLADGHQVHLYDGSLKWSQDLHAAILDIDVGDRDLQQCADAIMRLRAEYLFSEKRYAHIAFNFTNGWKFEYSKWREGNDLVVAENKTSWKPSSAKKESYTEFRNYLSHVFMYAGTLSMSKELKSKDIKDLQVGDIFIKGGSPGHAVVVVDVAIDKVSGDKAFLLAQSYMPAQQIHILKNLNNSTISPWYKLSEINDQLYSPEWTFSRNSLASY